MTSFTAIFLASWAIGYVLGYKLKMIRMVFQAS